MAKPRKKIRKKRPVEAGTRNRCVQIQTSGRGIREEELDFCVCWRRRESGRLKSLFLLCFADYCKEREGTRERELEKRGNLQDRGRGPRVRSAHHTLHQLHILDHCGNKKGRPTCWIACNHYSWQQTRPTWQVLGIRNRTPRV